MEVISMSREERKRLEVLSRVKSGSLSLVAASELLGLSYRQTKRIWSRYQSEGDRGLVHRLRGRASNRQPDRAFQEQALQLFQERYADYGPTLAAECLGQEERVNVPVTTLRRWLKAAGLWQCRRKRKVHRQRRPRRPHRGELVQMDGSHHDWFEGRRPWAVLMVMIDDATGTIEARFFENESWASAAAMFRAYVLRRGLPRALYVDRHGIYRAEREPRTAELLADIEPETQFGRALRELDVELILARSPQAKGRVERMNGTRQDRLVKALRRGGISDIESANAFLEETFLPEFNAQFSRPPTRSRNLHRSAPALSQLDQILSIQEERVVQNDWTVRWQNRFLQLTRACQDAVRPGQSVTLCAQLDGTLRVFLGPQELAWSATRTEPARAKLKALIDR